jgi:uncharacterized tellurite resistance protein B-like protein
VIIFGTRGVTLTKESGVFFCPECECKQSYRHRTVRRFFTLYFVPVIPLDALGEYVECDRCKNTYRNSILMHDPEQRAKEFEVEYHQAVRKVMLQMVLADGSVCDEEIASVSALYLRITGHALNPEEVRRELSMIGSRGLDIAGTLQPFSGSLNDHGKEMVIKAAFFVAISDGDFDQAEITLLEFIGESLEMSRHHVRGVVRDLMDSMED